MITEYHRPETIEEALKLLGRRESTHPRIPVFPLGGGTILNRPFGSTLPPRQEFAVVDLQRLGLDGIEQRGNQVVLGATLTLAKFLEMVEGASETQIRLPKDLASAIRLETTYNLRQTATLAGRLVGATGRSPLATALLALDVDLAWTAEHLYPDLEKVSLGEFLLSRDTDWSGKLITQVVLPVNARLALETVARTPSDIPIVCAAVAVWPSGRWRVTLGGYGSAPKLAWDGYEKELALDGVGFAASSAYLSSGDEWASAEYRSEMARVLVKRCLRRVLPEAIT